MPTYTIRSIEVNFPYEAYECQLTYMEKVIQALQEGWWPFAPFANLGMHIDWSGVRLQCTFGEPHGHGKDAVSPVCNVGFPAKVAVALQHTNVRHIMSAAQRRRAAWTPSLDQLPLSLVCTQDPPTRHRFSEFQDAQARAARVSLTSVGLSTHPARTANSLKLCAN